MVMASVQTTVKRKLTKNTRCMICKQRIHYMQDPRWLPCTHAFCIGCLSATVGSKCGVCNKSYDKEKLRELETVDVDAISRKAEDIDGSKCDLCCTDEIVPATQYCEDCNQQMCAQHTLEHNRRSKASCHTMMDINRINSRILEKGSHLCEEHNKYVTLVCCRCRKLFCEICSASSAVCEMRWTHIITEISTLAVKLWEKLTAETSILKKKAEEIDDEMMKIKEEKANIDNAMKLMEIVESRSDEDEKAEKHKQDIQLYINECEANKNTILKEMKMVRDQMLRQAEAVGLLDPARQLTIIMVQRNYSRQFRETMLLKVPEYVKDCGRSIALSEDGTELIYITKSRPVKLTHQRSVAGTCLSVSWSSDGYLLSCRETGFVLYDKNLKKLQTDKVYEPYLQCAVPYPHGYIFMVYSPHINKILLILTDESLKSRRIFDTVHGTDNFYTKKDGYTKVCYVSSRSEILAVDAAQRQLKAYDIDGKYEFSLELPNSLHPSGIHVLADCGIVVSDTNKTVSKYVLGDGEALRVWCCVSILSPAGVSSDSSGFIYVASYMTDRIYILSSNGEKLKFLTSHRLTYTRIEDVAVYGEQLAVATGRGGIFVFNIEREEVNGKTKKDKEVVAISTPNA